MQAGQGTVLFSVDQTGWTAGWKIIEYGKTSVLHAAFWNHGLTPPHVFQKYGKYILTKFIL
jgi:hypothetical protein